MLRLFSVLLLPVLLSPALCRAETVSADRLFPESTKGFFSVKNLEEFQKLWKQTQFGQFINDPLMSEFKADLQKQLSRRLESVFAFSLDTVSSLPSGEVAFGMIAVPNQKPGNVMTMDVTGKRPQTDQYLSDLSAKLAASGVRQSAEQYKGQKITVLKFPPPAAPAPAEAAKEKDKPVQEPVIRNVFYMFRQDILIVSDQLHLIKLIADRVVDDAGRSLADVPDYQATLKRCTDDMPKGTKPAAEWYIEPLDYGESIRILLQKSVSKRKNKPSIFTVLKEQGFDAVRGIGGVISMKSEGMETVFRTFVCTKQPYRLAMRMLEFPDQKDFTPPDWLPADLARSTTFRFDPLKIFDNFGILFDSVVMQGEEGVWKDILKGLEEDPHGPQINLRNELIAHIGNRAVGMSRYDKPITPKSESTVIAVELKDGRYESMQKSVEKLFGTDTEMKFTMYKKYKIWHRIPPEDILEPEEMTEKRLIDVPAPNKTKERPAAVEPDTPSAFPDGGIVVTPRWLLVSSQMDYLSTILDRMENTAAKSTAFKNEKDYKKIEQIYSEMRVLEKPRFLQFFARSDETIRPTYETLRRGQMPESQAMLAKLINFIIISEDENGRKQIVDGTKLPAFDKVQKYFGVLSLYGSSEKDGYFFKGFSLEPSKTK